MKYAISRTSGVLMAIVLLMIGLSPGQATGASLINTSGKVTLLRVHALGSRYGPPADSIDVEVVIRLDRHTDMGFGFQLREGEDRAVRQAMLDLLRDAFNHGWTVSIDYWIDTGKKNGIIHRVWLTKG